MLTYGSLFTGIGGFDLGFDRAGLSCLWQIEKDNHCQAVLSKHWLNAQKFGDIQNVGRDELRSVDLICGGFPCQDVSVAGKRKGLAGKRSGLWFEFHRILGELTPRWVIIENVPGLLSSNEGQDFATILRGLAELGYYAAWRILDAQYFGVAQRRRRVFVVASLGNGRCAEVLFESESGAWDSAPGKEERTRIAGTLAAGAHPSGFNGRDAEQGKLIPVGLSNRGNATGKIVETVRADSHGALPMVAFGGNNIQGDIDIATAVNAHGSRRYDFESETFITNAFNGYTGGADDNDAQGNHLVVSRSIRPRSGMPQGWNSNLITNYQPGVRRLTPTECERLQGFPDGWTAGQSDTQRYRQLGNAVAVPVAEWIGRRILAIS